MCTVIISDCTVITWSCTVMHGRARSCHGKSSVPPFSSTVLFPHRDDTSITPLINWPLKSIILPGISWFTS